MTWLLLISLLLTQAPTRQQLGGGVVAGEIRLPDGRAAAGVLVRTALVAGTGANGAPVVLYRSMTDESGRYRIENIPVGTYYIAVGEGDTATYYPGTSNLADARTVTIVPESILQAVDFVIPQMPRYSGYDALFGGISGKIVTDNGRSWPLFLPSLYIHVENGNRSVMGADGVKIRGTGTFGATPVGKDGTFRLTLPDGEFAISLVTSLGEPLTAADGYYVKSMVSGTTDLLKEKLRVARPSLQSITITLSATR
jgi:hypothetical protein